MKCNRCLLLGSLIFATLFCLLPGFALSAYAQDQDPATLIEQGDHLLFQSDFVAAEAAYTAAIELDPQNATAYAHRCYLRTFQQAYQAAIADCNKAIELDPDNAVGYIYLTRAYDWNAEFDKAIEIGEKAVAMAPQNGLAYGFLGEAYLDAGRLQDADAALTKAAILAPNEAEIHRNMAYLHQAHGEFEAVIAEFMIAIRQEPAFLKYYIEQGIVYLNLNQYAQTATSFQKALKIARKVGDIANEGAMLYSIGAIYSRQQSYSQALVHYKAALEIMRKIEDSFGEGAILNKIGEVYHHQGRYGEALANYEQALAIAQDVGDRRGEGTTLNNIAGIYHAQGRYGEALASYEQALAILREVGDRSGEGTTLNNIGAVYRAQGRYGEALASYEQALAILGEVGDRAGEGTALNNIGGIYDVQGRYSEALHYYRDGIEVLERVRSGAGSDQARTILANDYAETYDRIVALHHQQEDIAQAFWYSERGRARTLLDLLSTGEVQLNDNEAAALLAAEQEAYAVRRSTQDALAKARAASPPDPTLVSQAEANVKAAEAAYEQAAIAITARSGQLASLIPGRQQVPQLPEVQALLDVDTTLLSYWTLEDKTLAFVITAKDATIVELPGVTAQSVLTLTENLRRWSNLDNPHPFPLRQLYQALITPLAAKLKTPHLAIIPHQSLHYVPFAALVDEAHDKQYLGEQYTLSLLPSASMLPFLQQNATAAQANRAGGAVVFGDPASNEPGLPRLHYAATEASAVADLLNTAVLTATAARETTLKQAARGARIVHLAAHGAYNQANALYSAIYLAPSSPLTPTQPITATDGLPTVDTSLDGRLETHEIFGLPLEGNDLVVLSACQTNLGNLSRGDELVGLTRAFFFAKSPTVISSLWNVDDAATETLMVSFYRHWLDEGMSKAQALQAAQSDVRVDPRWVSPFYWAGFVLNGHPGDHK